MKKSFCDNYNGVRCRACAYADVQPVNQWISVKDRLPDTDERVLVYIPRPDNHYNIEIAYISEGNDDYPYWVLRDKSQFYSTSFYYISHWQSLPELPKDGEPTRNLTDEETEIYDSWLNSEATDEQTVRHGRWVECCNELDKKCSCCDKVHGTIYEREPFCPNCGADMRKDKLGW